MNDGRRDGGRSPRHRLLVDSLECEDAFELRTRHPMFAEHMISHLLAATSRDVREHLIRHMTRPSPPGPQLGAHVPRDPSPGDEAGPWQEWAIRLMEDGTPRTE